MQHQNTTKLHATPSHYMQHPGGTTRHVYYHTLINHYRLPPYSIAQQHYTPCNAQTALLLCKNQALQASLRFKQPIDTIPYATPTRNNTPCNNQELYTTVTTV